MNEQSPTAAQQKVVGVLLLVGIASVTWFGVNWWTGHSVVSKALDRYATVKQSGTPSLVCNEAENVVAAMQYAKREADWIKWKDQAAMDCQLAK